jgi:hypothetical protein
MVQGISSSIILAVVKCLKIVFSTTPSSGIIDMGAEHNRVGISGRLQRKFAGRQVIQVK